MSFRTVAGLASAAAVLLAPAAQASQIDRVCALTWGSAVPSSLWGWHCAGTGPQKPGCQLHAAVPDPRTGVTLVGVEVCGLL